MKYEINAYTNHPVRMPYILRPPRQHLGQLLRSWCRDHVAHDPWATRFEHVAMSDMYLAKDYGAKSSRIERRT
jgi:hypothetical protein